MAGTSRLERTTSRRDAPRQSRARGFVLLTALVALMWVVEMVDMVTAVSLDHNGIRPRDEDGLTGVLFAPFLHGGLGHLVSNTVPMVVLGALIALGGLLRIAAVTVVVGLVAGLGTWLVAPAGTLHIGASGIVFGYLTYLIIRGFHSGRPLHLVAGVVVALVWGGTLLSGLIPSEGISWQGHLFGAIGGVVAARLLHRRD